ncbi:hypothetical protein [Ruegeria arenilitoris]|uniref:hypothetical protein n=1 Tax=Ruegeria arenilitoris TaxID=1173585 RepID=UPI0014815E6D|nr:hypothetical protein [Ruegeria arenilitoris]
MELIADILLVAGALGAGLYCFVLSRRLKRFTDLEKGVGGAVAVLSTQADELKKSLGAARDASDQSGEVLKELTLRAESVAQRLELMMASMHDVVPPEEKAAKPAESEPAKPAKETSATPEADEETTAAESEATPESSEKPAEPEDSVEAADKPAALEDTDETSDKPPEPDSETPAATPAKRPDGLMFFRHTRSRDEATT